MVTTINKKEIMTDIIMDPTAAIEQAQNCCQFKRVIITTKTKPADFAAAKILINDRLSKFKLLANSAVKRVQEDQKADVGKYRDISSKDIVLSAISDDFAVRHAEEIRETTNSTTLLSLLEDIIGTPSQAQIRSEAEDNLSNLTRDIDNEEKFERFYKRLDRLAKKASDDATIQNHLVKKAFNRNLTPRIRSFLHEREKINIETNEMAQYLDKMLKFKKTAYVNSIDSSEPSEQMIELQKQNTEMHDKMHTMHDKMDSMQRLLAALLENQTVAQQNLDVQVNQIRPQKPAPKPIIPKNKGTRPPTQQVQQQPQTRYINPAWELNRYGAPFTCRKCGLRGHRDENCKGTNIVCHTCGQAGHIKYVCPQRPQQPTSSKNL